jgi:hypothetical protein
MATLTIPYNFTNNTAAIATEVNQNFLNVKTFAEALAAGTNIDDGSIAYVKLNAALQLLVSGPDSENNVIGSQVFG